MSPRLSLLLHAEYAQLQAELRRDADIQRNDDEEIEEELIKTDRTRMGRRDSKDGDLAHTTTP